MNNIVLIGLNHKTAPIELRERLALSKEEASEGMKRMLANPSVSEAIMYSTCNRVETLIAVEENADPIEDVKTCLSEIKNIHWSEFEKFLYTYKGNEAVQHFFRVAASLDSMMVGEPQILGQLKEAYRTATSVKASGVILNRMVHRSFFVAKRVRTETGIGNHAVSISYAAVELGRKIFGTFEEKKVLLIGAGEMAELAVELLVRNRVEEIIVANRTFEHGINLAKKFNGKAIRFEEIPDTLQFVDIIISSTGSSEIIVSRDQVKKIIRRRRNRPIFFIDIAVPRDIDPEIHRLSNSYVYDIDDLKSVIEENIEDRNREAVKGKRIVDEAVIKFNQWFESLEAVPTIVDLKTKLETIAKTEAKKNTPGIIPFF
jgi:glutamyl-tRNA reductase